MSFSLRRFISTYVLFSLCVLSVVDATAKDADSTKTKAVSIFPFPVFSYTPETNFLFGAGASFTFRFKKDPPTAKPTNIFAGGAYTLNKQILLYTLYKVFYDSSKYYFFGEVGYFKYNFFYYGVGQNAVSEELYDVDFPRIMVNATRRALPNIYLGVRYQYENFQVHNQQPAGELVKGDIPGSLGSVVSGAGIGMVYDSRDSIFYPRKGFYSETHFTNYGKLWGGNFNYNRLIIDVTGYKVLFKDVVLATNSYNSFITGTAPFQQMSLVGGTKKMRGYYEGTFRDQNLMMLQAETRFPLFWRFGAVAFGSVGFIGNDTDFVRFNDPKYTYGAGLRFKITPKDHLNLRIDYGIGPGTSGAYITIGEAF